MSYVDEPRHDVRGAGVRQRRGADRAALIIHSAADAAAGFLVLWILLYLLDANRANVFVGFVEGAAHLSGWWAEDIFTMDNPTLRVVLNQALPALIYLAVGHGAAARVRRL